MRGVERFKLQERKPKMLIGNADFWMRESSLKDQKKEDDESLGLRAVREEAATAMRQIKTQHVLRNGGTYGSKCNLSSAS